MIFQNLIHMHLVIFNYVTDFEKSYKGKCSPFMNRKVNISGEIFLISKVVWIQIKNSNPVYYTTRPTSKKSKSLIL